jgi:predicted TPR repeat methyltransferase
VIRAAAGALARNGFLILSVERALDDRAGESGHVLNPHGRYSHSEAYVRRVLAESGLTPLSLDPAVLRKESGSPVEGLIVTAQSRT